jgi:hypothetical protein
MVYILSFILKTKWKGTNLTPYILNLPFGPESFVLSSAVKKLKNYKIQDDNFACRSVWVWNLVSDIKGGT